MSTVQHAVSSVQCPGAVLEIMESRARSDTEQYKQDTAASPDLAPDQQSWRGQHNRHTHTRQPAACNMFERLGEVRPVSSGACVLTDECLDRGQQ